MTTGGTRFGSAGASGARLVLVRHAPADAGGRLAGRRDVPALIPAPGTMATVRACVQAALGPAQHLWVSPALRCRQTAKALALAAPLPPPPVHPALLEQDFGAWDGMAPDLLPDLGPLPTHELAQHVPPGGESFAQMAGRVQAHLAKAQGATLIVAHAGTVRAALALVVGPAALSFSVAPLSVTVMTRQDGIWSVQAVNVT